MPRCILAEFNTHRKISGGDPDYADFVGSISANAASSRAIPVARMIRRIAADPYIPDTWGENQPGMSMGESIPPGDAILARQDYLNALDNAVLSARRLAKLNVHKEIINRLLEPFAWTRVLATATEWSGFFALRTAPQASPAFRQVALRMLAAYQQGTPTGLELGRDHLPYINPDEREHYAAANLRRISAARAARVSYLNHDGECDPIKDLDLFERLAQAGHWSPMEHVATALASLVASGNFLGWLQYRKVFAGEYIHTLPDLDPGPLIRH